jgi:hypothetical protein
MVTMQNHLTLRKSGKMGKSLHVTIPGWYIRDHELNAGDIVFWTAEPDGIKLKFVHAQKAYNANQSAEQDQPRP